MRVFEALD